MACDYFFSEFGMTIDEAESKLKLMAEQSDKRWLEIVNNIENKSKNQSNKDKIKWQMELLRRKKIAESF